jgi:chromosome segregation ATPase
MIKLISNHFQAKKQKQAQKEQAQHELFKLECQRNSDRREIETLERKLSRDEKIVNEAKDYATQTNKAYDLNNSVEIRMQGYKTNIAKLETSIASYNNRIKEIHPQTV